MVEEEGPSNALTQDTEMGGVPSSLISPSNENENEEIEHVLVTPTGDDAHGIEQQKSLSYGAMYCEDMYTDRKTSNGMYETPETPKYQTENGSVVVEKGFAMDTEM